MGRHSGGFFIVQRRIMNGPVGADGHTLAIWVTLQAWAAWQDGVSSKKGAAIKVRRGQVLTSTGNLASQLDIDRKTVLRRLHLLKELGLIECQMSHRGTVITLCNYEEDQDIKTPTVSLSGPQNGPQKGHLRTKEQKERINVPPEPPAGGALGRRVSARSREQQAAALVERTIGAVNECLSAEEAKERLGPEAFGIVTTRHKGSWVAFTGWIHKRAARVDLGLVERDLRKTYAGLMRDQEPSDA